MPLPYLPRVDLAIDHHPSQEFFARETCLDAWTAACGEVMYDILRQLGPVTTDIALPSVCGRVHRLRLLVYGNTSANTHRVARALMDTGIPAADLKNATSAPKASAACVSGGPAHADPGASTTG